MTTTLAPPQSDPPPGEPNVRRVLVGPAQAEELLARMDRNRRLQQGWVNELAQIMLKGNWQEIGDTIRLDREGRLQDGQHRLRAIIKSGCSAYFWIIEGLAPEAQDVMDRGRRRTVGDVLTIHGVAQGQMMAAAIKWVMAITEGKLGLKNERGLALRPTPDDTLLAVAAHPGLEASLKVGRTAKTAAFRYPPSLAAALHYLMACKAGTEAADEFFDMLFVGDELPAGEPVWLLRDYLVRDSVKHTRRSSLDKAIWTVKAWNGWRNHATVRTLKAYPDHPFPEISD